jgi:hypothetical protein
LIERGQVQNCWTFMEVEQRHIIKFFMKEGMKGVESIDGMNK